MSNLSPAEVTAAVVSKDGDAAAVKPMKGGAVLSPLPLSGGRRKTKRLSKKVLRMLKGMSKKKLAKLMKGGVEEGEDAEGAVGGRKRGKTARRTRRSTLLY